MSVSESMVALLPLLVYEWLHEVGESQDIASIFRFL